MTGPFRPYIISLSLMNNYIMKKIIFFIFYHIYYIISYILYYLDICVFSTKSHYISRFIFVWLLLLLSYRILLAILISYHPISMRNVWECMRMYRSNLAYFFILMMQYLFNIIAFYLYFLRNTITLIIYFFYWGMWLLKFLRRFSLSLSSDILLDTIGYDNIG